MCGFKNLQGSLFLAVIVEFSVLAKIVLFVCLWLHEQFFSYLAIVTIIGDRAEA
jgi:hypothetical protein